MEDRDVYNHDIYLLTTAEGWRQIDKAVRAVSARPTPLTDDEYVDMQPHNGEYVYARWQGVLLDDELYTVMQTLSQFEATDGEPFEVVEVGGGAEYINRNRFIPTSNFKRHCHLPRLVVSCDVEVEY